MKRFWCPICNDHIPEKWRENHEQLMGHYLEEEKLDMDKDDDGVR